MQHPLRDKLESAALRLDDVLNSSSSASLGKHEGMLLSAADEIAQALHILEHGDAF